MKRAVLLLAIAILGGCGRRMPTPEILGEINNEYLTTDEFMHQLKVRGGADLRGDARRDFKRWLLAELVDRKLLLQEARRCGIRPAREDVRERMNELGSAGWETAERDRFLNVEDDLWEQTHIEQLMRRELPPVKQPTRREVKKWIEAHPAVFARPAQIRLRQIVVHSAAMVEKAETMLRDGETFEETAVRLGGRKRASAIGPSWVGQDDVPAEVWEAAGKAADKRLFGPVASEYGFHLLRVEGRRPAGMVTGEEAEARAKRRIVDERRKALVGDLLARLRRSAVIRVDQRAVDGL